jgi:REP element-mobilizing transposase RayT
MPSVDRRDEPGAWHHVMNRGIARRVVFENREDIRYFLSRIARAVRRGDLELHAFAILATHFHLMVRSPAGRLSAAIMRVEHDYVRWFNRRRRRDGSLFRGRFLSRRVDSDNYWNTLLHYIDDNPVAARVVRRSIDYPWCSAWHYARGRGPRWLTRTEVEGAVEESLGVRCDRDSYATFAAVRDAETSRWVVERRLAMPPSTAIEPLDELVLGAPPAVLDWMRRKALLADGTAIADVAAPPRSIDREIERGAAAARSSTGNASISLQQLAVMRAGLLRDLAGLRVGEIALRMKRPNSTIARWLEEHRRRLTTDERYGAVVGAAAFRVLRGGGK